MSRVRVRNKDLPKYMKMCFVGRPFRWATQQEAISEDGRMGEGERRHVEARSPGEVILGGVDNCCRRVGDLEGRG